MKLKFNGKIFLSTITLAFVTLTTPVLANGYYTYDYSTTASDAAAASVFGASWLISLCCFCLLPLIVGAVLAYVVYKDAKKNNVENPALWAVITFFFSVVGLLVYFLAIRPEAMKKSSGTVTAATPTSSEETKQS